MNEASIISAVSNAGGAVIIAVVCLILVIKINKTHEERIASFTRQICDIADRDIKSREEYTKVTQSLVDVIQYLTDSFMTRLNKG